MIPLKLIDLVREYQKDNPINRELKALLSEIEKNRSIRFLYIEISTKFVELISKGILKKDGSILDGKDVGMYLDPLGYYAFYQHFGPILNYQLSTDYNALLDFIDTVGQLLNSKGHRFGITQLTNGLIHFLVGAVNDLEGSDIHGFACKFNLGDQKDSRHQFLSEYLAILPSEKLTAEKFWEAITHLAIVIGGPKPGVIDPRWQKLQNIVIQYCKENATEAIKLKGLSIGEVGTSIVKELLPAVLLGGIEASVISLGDIIPMISDHQTARYALMVLLSNSPIEKDSKTALINILENEGGFEVETRVFIPPVLLSLLEKAQDEDEELNKRCQNLFKRMLLNGEDKVPEACLYAMCQSVADVDFLIGLLKEKVCAPSFRPEQISLINSFFCTHIDIEKFFDFLRFFALQLGMRFSFEMLEDAIEAHEHKDNIEFGSKLVSMIIDNEGRIRFVGHEILLLKDRLSETPKLLFDPLTLAAVSQYKYVISLLIPFHQVHQVVPLVVPLFRSPHPVVVEVLFCKLEELIDSYKIEVIETVSTQLEEGDIQKKIIIDRLNKYLQDLGDRISAQAKIKEFNPHFTQPSFLRKYSSAFTKSSSKSFKNARNNRKGLIDFATSVTVARGGGFVMPGHNTITPLRKVSVSWTMPRIIFIEPERQDFKRIEIFSDNWKEDFMPWQQIISS